MIQLGVDARYDCGQWQCTGSFDSGLVSISINLRSKPAFVVYPIQLLASWKMARPSQCCLHCPTVATTPWNAACLDMGPQVASPHRVLQHAATSATSTTAVARRKHQVDRAMSKSTQRLCNSFPTTLDHRLQADETIDALAMLRRMRDSLHWGKHCPLRMATREKRELP